jgi:hypothetical protein
MLQRARLQIVQQLDIRGVFKHLLEVSLRKEFALAAKQDHDLSTQPVIVVGGASQPEEVLVEFAAGLNRRKDSRAKG